MEGLPEIEILDNSDFDRLGITVATCTDFEIAQSIANHLVEKFEMDVEVFYRGNPEKSYKINSTRHQERVEKLNESLLSKV